MRNNENRLEELFVELVQRGSLETEKMNSYCWSINIERIRWLQYEYEAMYAMYAMYAMAFKYILTKEINRFVCIWIQTLIQPVISMILYFLIFGNLRGKQIGEMGWVSYMEFIAQGLIMMSVITASYSNIVSSFFIAKFQCNLEELIVTPIPHYVIIVGGELTA